jgi:hypothetical protein
MGLQGQPCEYIQRLQIEDQQQNAEALTRGMAAADRVWQERNNELPSLGSKIGSSACMAVAGAGLGLIIANFAFPSLDLTPSVIGAISGAVVGGVVGWHIVDLDRKYRADNLTFPEYQRAFEVEVNWIRNKKPLLDQELQNLDAQIQRLPQNHVDRVHLTATKTQLVALKTYFDMVLERYTIIVNAGMDEAPQFDLPVPDYGMNALRKRNEQEYRDRIRWQNDQTHRNNLQRIQSQAYGMAMAQITTQNYRYAHAINPRLYH